MMILAAISRKMAGVVLEWRVALEKRTPALLKEYAEIGSRYHIWYYNTAVHERVRFLGIQTQKSVSDMWNYQEIIASMKAALVVEFGSLYGGSALYFQAILAAMNQKHRVLSVDIDHSRLQVHKGDNANIEFMTVSSVDPSVAKRIRELRAEIAGPVFFILDSDHVKDHVLGELLLLRDITRAGDYVIVEDSNINAHPVMPGFGPGPYEAVEEYFALHPSDYRRDLERETKFGFTYAPNGFLIRQ